MLVLGLTGSIGMGKTTVANNFKRFGFPVHDSDAAVRELSGPQGLAFKDIVSAFPSVIANGAIDKGSLGSIVFQNRAKLSQLEAILHPHVRSHRQNFLAHASRARTKLVVLDVPLLFETGWDRHCDRVIVVSAPRFIQAARVLARPGMTRDKLAVILERQMPDVEKCRRADFIVRTGLSRIDNLRSVFKILKIVRCRTGKKWPPFLLRPKFDKK
ncbi:MAG: dephospho-CoA kinase [Magnetovibrio sp.]|nr:dephospho-CoA kinase [Magnetovibrio sp.]